MAMTQRYITTRPGGPSGSSIDTWDTLAARATQQANTMVSAGDLIGANVGAGATYAQVNSWIAGIGGTLSGDGVNYILPAGMQIALPISAAIPTEADAEAVNAAVDAGPMISAAPSTNLLLGILAAGAGALVLYELLGSPKRERRALRRARRG